MKKNKLGGEKEVKTEEVKIEEAIAAPVVEAEPLKSESEELLAVDVSFTDEHVAAIVGAGLEPAQVRNEIGLESNKLTKGKVVNNPPAVLSFKEALDRAIKRYKSV